MIKDYLDKNFVYATLEEGKDSFNSDIYLFNKGGDDLLLHNSDRVISKIVSANGKLFHLESEFKGHELYSDIGVYLMHGSIFETGLDSLLERGEGILDISSFNDDLFYIEKDWVRRLGGGSYRLDDYPNIIQGFEDDLVVSFPFEKDKRLESVFSGKKVGLSHLFTHVAACGAEIYGAAVKNSGVDYPSGVLKPVFSDKSHDYFLPKPIDSVAASSKALLVSMQAPGTSDRYGVIDLVSYQEVLHSDKIITAMDIINK